MNYDNVLLPQYMKKTLKNYDYENTWYVFHRGLYADSSSANYLKNTGYIKTLNTVLGLCYTKSKEYITGMRDKKDEIEDYYTLLERRPGYIYNKIDAESIAPVVIGMGSQSVSENSMQIHPIYGIPYIAGQQVKGVVRSFYLNEKFKGDENKAWTDSKFVFLFGKGQNEKGCDSPYPAKEGHLIFYDVFPTADGAVFHSAQMTNHYPEYYQGKKLTDGENPIPISYLTIEKLKMRFSYGIAKMCIESYMDKTDSDNSNEHNEGDVLSDKNENLIKNQKELEEILKDVGKNLDQAMTYYGFGAKTAVGYGRFENIDKKISKKTTRTVVDAHILEKGRRYEVKVVGYCEEPKYLELEIMGFKEIGRIKAKDLERNYNGKMKSHDLYVRRNNNKSPYKWELCEVKDGIAYFKK